MQNAFLTVLNMSLSGAVVILAIMLARLLLKRAPKKWSYMLWLAAGFRLVCPVSIRAVFSLFSFAPKTIQGSAANAGSAVSSIDYLAALSVPQVSPAPLTPVSSVPAQTAYAVTAAPAPAGSAAPLPSMSAAITVLSVLWLAGAATMLIAGAVNYFRLRDRLATATRLNGVEKNNVFRSENVDSPFIFGFLHPRIYIPYGLSRSSLEYVLMHEYHHLRRGDHIARAIAYLILALHWFDPVVWLGFCLMGRDMELSCDEKVLSLRPANREYSSTLLSLASLKRFPSPNPLAFGECAVKSRIANAMRYKKPKLIITVIAALLTASVLTACIMNPGGSTPGKPEANTIRPGAAETPVLTCTPVPEPDPSAEITACPYLLRIPVDLDGDGSANEYFVLDVGELSSLKLTVPRIEDAGGNSLGELDPIGVSHASLNSYAYTVINGKNYVLEYRPNSGAGMYQLYYRLWTVKDGQAKVVEEKQIEFSVMDGRPAEPNDVDAILDIVESVNRCWENGRLIAATDMYGMLADGLYEAAAMERYEWDKMKPLIAAGGTLGPLPNLDYCGIDEITYRETLPMLDANFIGYEGYSVGMSLREKLEYSNFIITKDNAWAAALNALEGWFREDYDNTGFEVTVSERTESDTRFVVFFPASCFSADHAHDTWVTVDNGAVTAVAGEAP